MSCGNGAELVVNTLSSSIFFLFCSIIADQDRFIPFNSCSSRMFVEDDEFVYEMVRFPSRCLKDLGKSVVSCTFDS